MRTAQEERESIPTAELHELRRLRKRRPFPIPSDACRIIDEFGGSTQQTGQVTFTLSRRAKRVRIMLCVTMDARLSFSWNVTSMLNLSHQSYAEARDWVHAYAAGFGQLVVENVPYRKPRPSGEDGKLFREGGCKEEWLESDLPDLCAAAMTRCQHPGGYCGQDGFCHYGDCDMQMRLDHLTAEGCDG